MGRNAIAGTIAFILLIASLVGLWRVLIEKAELRLTAETLSDWARQHPPKPWRGFDIAILNVSVNRDVQIKAHISGHHIHTPIDVSGSPEFNANARAVFFHVRETKLPRNSTRPMLRRLNAVLDPLATYIAQNLTEIIPAKKIKPDTRGAMLLTTVKSVRVDGDAVIVEFQGQRVAAAAGVLVLCALLSSGCLLALWLRAKRARTIVGDGSGS